MIEKIYVGRQGEVGWWAQPWPRVSHAVTFAVDTWESPLDAAYRIFQSHYPAHFIPGEEPDVLWGEDAVDDLPCPPWLELTLPGPRQPVDDSTIRHRRDATRR
jgi:hypothetical protein